MHFLVNHTKRDLHNVLITTLYKESLFEEMLKEPDEISTKRKRIRETLKVLQQAYRTLDEIPLEAENVEKGYADTTGLLKVYNLPPSFYDITPKSNRSRKSHSGEQQPSFLHSHADANGLGSYSPIGI